MAELSFLERPAQGTAQGLLILHHGRGTNEEDLFPLAELLDPQQRLVVVTPRAPLQLANAPGYHWYAVREVGHPDPATFHAAYRELSLLHDHLFVRTGVPPERTVIGGFSMGCVMSYALGLAGDRPQPAGILAFSGFIPNVEGWKPHPSDRQSLPVFIAHGQHDPVIPVQFARAARDVLAAGGLELLYRESNAAHNIAQEDLAAAAEWLGTVIRPCETP